MPVPQTATTGIPSQTLHGPEEVLLTRHASNLLSKGRDHCTAYTKETICADSWKISNNLILMLPFFDEGILLVELWNLFLIYFLWKFKSWFYNSHSKFPSVITWFLKWNFQLQKDKHQVIYYLNVILKYFIGAISVVF